MTIIIFMTVTNSEIKASVSASLCWFFSLQIPHFIRKICSVSCRLRTETGKDKDDREADEEKADQGIKPNTIRLSIGTEHIDDIIEDLDEAFKAISE